MSVTHPSTSPDEVLIEYQQRLDTSFARMYQYKTHIITDMMNTPCQARTLTYHKDHSNTFDPSNPRTHDIVWKDWLLVINVKTDGVLVGSPITQGVKLDEEGDRRSAIAALSLTFAYGQLKKPHPQTCVGETSKTLDALGVCIQNLNAKECRTWEPLNDEDTMHVMDISTAQFTFKTRVHTTNTQDVPDHRFEQYTDCLKITRGFDLQPMELNVYIQSNDPAATTTLHVVAYPRHVQESVVNGLLVATVKSTNDASVAVTPMVVETDTLALSYSPETGFNEHDAARIMVRQTREDLDKAVQKFTSVHIMHAVLKKNDPGGTDIPAVAHMTQACVATTHEVLKGKLDALDRKNNNPAVDSLHSQCTTVAASIWGAPHPVHTPDDTVAGNNGPCYTNCIGGTVDCFSNNIRCMDMVLHTNNEFSVKFMFDNQPFHVSNTIPMSMYAKYYVA